MKRLGWMVIAACAFGGAATAQECEEGKTAVSDVGESSKAAWQAVAADALSGKLPPKTEERAAKVKAELTAELDKLIERAGGDLPELFSVQYTIGAVGGELAGAMDFRTETLKRFPGSLVTVQTLSDFPVAGDFVTVIYHRPKGYQPQHQGWPDN